jgi:hypothetical protein
MLSSARFSFLPIAIGVVVIGGLLLLARRRTHGRKKNSKGVSTIGWALLFLTSGRMPPPPPESQIEQDLNARDNRNQSAGRKLH